MWSFDGEDPNDTSSEEQKEYLNSLPEYEIVSSNGLKMLFSHYIFPDLTGSTTRHVEAKTPYGRSLEIYGYPHNVKFSLSGHSHKSHACLSRQRGSFSFVRAIHSVRTTQSTWEMT
ncbi:MAG: hypothetical protein MZV63_21775 [Marinilabiliales bacterium]|nr:hypothetical protein [Marinilabiliales bacterium]